MTRDEILIAMKEVGAAKHDLMPKTYEGVVDVFERFAAIARAAERNAILQMSNEQWFKTQADFEAAIRARGQE